MCADETKPFQTKVLCGDAEAVELLVGFPGDEEGQGVPARGLGRGQGQCINGLLGFQGWLGILPSAHTLKVANIEASRKEGVKEVWPRTSRILP